MVGKCHLFCRRYTGCIEVLRCGWTYRVACVQTTGRRKNDIKIRHYNDLIRSTVEADRECIRAEMEIESAPSAESSTGSTSTTEDSSSEDEYEDDDEEEAPAKARPPAIAGSTGPSNCGS